ncbi:hypothetical protein [Haloferax sp. Q22]|nr:hypothetical protein [Haloferax sp. Q22]
MNFLPKCRDCDAEMPEPVESEQTARNLAAFHADRSGHRAYVEEVDEP